MMVRKTVHPDSNTYGVTSSPHAASYIAHAFWPVSTFKSAP